MIDTETHNWLRYREKEGTECPALNGSAVLHPFLPRLKDHTEEGEERLQGPEARTKHKGAVSSRHIRAAAHMDSQWLSQPWAN